MRITKDPEIRKQEIIDRAKKLFEEKGIHKTSISEIAKEVGVAKGLIYYYFSSKNQLVESVIEQFILGIGEGLEEIMKNEELDFYSKLTAIFHLYFDSIQKHPGIFSLSLENPGIFSLIRNRLSEIALIHATDLITLGMNHGIINISYPEYMLKIIIRGLGDLYIEGVTNPEIHARLIEQILGLGKGKLQLK
ncbi:TetR/AcrR family transcriptional regulator [Irregularibacter muris]|uniref:TetR/AcrR family transcriptional regulator n=1 Tax=Irregularibacter muris TaxID=1796619 RepID=A0AAE3HH47_9FIRM|nr:TetR/AcrR family transcriptional regulator [Irregularibacter muris]MCR1899315.1 TetR/AcrR family transcriptional regulator [Irregularibacter muris]